MDLGFPISFHDVTILRNSDLYITWRDHFIHNEEYFEEIQGENMFIMRGLGQVEHASNMDEGELTAYNKMHTRFRVKGGVGALVA